MKKLFALLLAGLLLLTACGETDTPAEEKTEEPAKETEVKEEVEKEEEPQEVEEEKVKTPVTVEQVPYEFEMLKPDSIGAVYADFMFENKSEYPITGFDLTIKKKDDDEITYATLYETVMPGEKSPKFEASAAKTGKKEDMEFMKLDIVAKDKEKGIEYHINYDYKLDEYEVLEVEPE